MKKFIKNNIFGFIIGILACGVTVYAVSNAAKDITFKASNTNWKVGNVADALDSLYISKTEDNYSTEEKVVGTWIDGKPLYQITINFGALPNKTEKTVSAGLSNKNIDRVISISGYAYKPTANQKIIAIPFSSAGDWSLEMSYSIRDDLLISYATQDLSSYTESYVTIQYTKTTDNTNN